ncbi:M12 family metallo-peptidase [Candidatus Kapabacteria bacterium]|nr:M12 family metallo-peptidase [Candidatus Kapabacteria bacterium]
MSKLLLNLTLLLCITFTAQLKATDLGNNVPQSMNSYVNNISQGLIFEKTVPSFQLKKMKPVFDKHTKFFIGDKPTSAPNLTFYSGENANGDFIFISESQSGKMGIISTDNMTYHIQNNEVIAQTEMSVPADVLDAFSMENNEPLKFEPYVPSKSLNKLQSSKELLELEVAVETTTEFYNECLKNGKDHTEYLIELYQMVSFLYEKQMGIRLKLVHVQQWDDKNKDSYNHGSNPFTLMDKVKSNWKSNHSDIDRDIVNVLTAGGGGGLGNYNAVCETQGDNYLTFSPNCRSSYPFFSYTYDAHTLAHELGHNFGSPHTHDCSWGEPLDLCAVNDENEDCLPAGTEKVASIGTIMSYCREFGNTESESSKYSKLEFHPRVAEFIRDKAEGYSCLDRVKVSTIALVAGNGEKDYMAGDMLEISWNKYNTSNAVDVYLSTDNGESWNIILENQTADGEVIEYELPADICSNQCKIKVEDSKDNEVFDISIGTFTIKQETDIVAYYPFDGNADDETLCGFYPASEVTTPKLTTDRFGRENSAYEFDGKSMLVAEGFDSDFDELSVSVWVNPSKLDGKCNIIGTDFSSAYSWELYVWGALGGSVYLNGSGGPTQLYSNGLPLNKWSFVTFTFDGTKSKMYIDGTLRHTGDAKGELNKFKNVSLYIGSRSNNDYWTGKIDDIRIYNRAISDAEVAELYTKIDFVPDATILTSPANESTTDYEPTLRWNSVQYADSYQLQVLKSNTFDELIIDDEVTSTSESIEGLEYNVTYFWRVASINENGNSAWSETWSFTTENIPAPALITPANNAIEIELNSTISWESLGDDVNYQLQLSDDEAFANMLMDSSLTTSEIDAELESDKTYYWKVQSSTNTSTSQWSEVYKFTTITNTGIGIDAHDDLVISPNPFGDNISISGTFKSIELHDLNGNVLHSKHYDISNKYTYTLDATELPSGTYFVVIDNISYKIIKAQ